MKRTILCYGDSNTWGYIPGSECERYPEDVRWPGVLAAELGEAYSVIEAAQNGRTTVHDDPFEETCKNGSVHLPVVLEMHKPLDLVIVMLGTNDLKTHLGQSAKTIAHGAALIGDRIEKDEGAGRDGKAPRVLLVSPPAVNGDECPFWNLFEGAAEKSAAFPKEYREMAESLGLAFFDAATVTTCPVPDTIHLDAEGQGALGRALAGSVRGLLE